MPNRFEKSLSVRVNSSNLHSLEYDDKTSSLLVQFHSGHIYRYENITPAEYSALINAASSGSHLKERLARKNFSRVQ